MLLVNILTGSVTVLIQIRFQIKFGNILRSHKQIRPEAPTVSLLAADFKYAPQEYDMPLEPWCYA
jgi:hypothetical protein